MKKNVHTFPTCSGPTTDDGSDLLSKNAPAIDLGAAWAYPQKDARASTGRQARLHRIFRRQRRQE